MHSTHYSCTIIAIKGPKVQPDSLLELLLSVGMTNVTAGKGPIVSQVA